MTPEQIMKLIKELEKKMNEAVEEENYMLAAHFRDEIKQLKEKFLEKK